MPQKPHRPREPRAIKRVVNPRLTAGILLGAVVILGAVFWFLVKRARPQTIAPVPHPNALLAPSAPSATSATAKVPAVSVAIQDGKTLDFSSGKPVLKDSADEKAIIEQSVKEMNEAAAGVTFGPAPTPAPKK